MNNETQEAPTIRRFKKSGGAGRGAGRHKIEDKIKMVPISVRESHIKVLGGLDEVKQLLKSLAIKAYELKIKEHEAV